MTMSVDQLIELVSTLSYPELKGLQLVISQVLQHGYLPRPGYVEYRFISRRGKSYGPYKYRRLWHAGRLTDYYEGKATPEEYQAWLAHKAARRDQGT